jgi:hypothetical protein
MMRQHLSRAATRAQVMHARSGLRTSKLVAKPCCARHPLPSPDLPHLLEAAPAPPREHVVPPSPHARRSPSCAVPVALASTRLCQLVLGLGRVLSFVIVEKRRSPRRKLVVDSPQESAGATATRFC